ncbi:hypothetical protein [Micromonospora globbae]|uniref:hypothetical protein n=1 Tax=Micromonospora globbae TaxID=1894969 RepID=UPI0038657792|nr:hypothetical protein OH732_30125 [Micromonospora globbae]
MTAINQNRPPGGTTEQARQQASRVGQQTAHAGGQIGHTAAEQGREVAAQARYQAQHLTHEATSQLREQARMQQHRAAEGLRGLGRELGSVAERTDSGMTGEVVRRVADAAQRAAGWLDEREPADVLHEVRDYARRNPGRFLAGAAVAGLLFGRLTRSLTSSPDGERPEHRMPPGGQPYEREVTAPYTAESAYSGAARAENVSPDGRRQEPGVPGGVAP